MATYRLTPAERRARALERKKQSENRILYKSYLQQVEEYNRQREEYEKQVEEERLNAIWEERERNSQNFFVRGIHTIGDIAANVITGAVKGLEGIYDLGAGIVGAVGGIFDDGFQDRVKEHIAYDWTMETFGNDWQEALKYSYTKDGGIIEGVASGIGQMLPAVAVTIATGGAGAPAAVAQAASLATMGASAAGNATEEAFKDGASYYGGLGYGVASGVVEAATEKIFGGATKGIFGKGMADDLVKKSVASTGIKRVAKNALEEGIEEVAAELVNPALKSIYKGGEAFNEYGKGEYWLGVGKAGAIGSLTALAYSGSVGYGLSKVGKGYVGAEADINESLMEIDTQKKKAENLFANDKLTEKNDAQISSNVQENYRNIERTLQKANDKKRASLIEKFSLGSAFESNGTMKVDFATKLGFVAPTTQVDTQGQETTSRTLASLLRKEYYSPSLRGNETEVETDLKSITEKLKQDEIELAKEQGREVKEIAEVKPFTGELTDKGKKNYAQTKKAMNYLNSKSGRNVNIVVVDPHESINANIVDDRTIYIGADTFENDTWAGAIVHEYTHYAEGTKEYVKLVNYLQSDPKLLDKAFTSFVNRGYANADMIKTINEKQARGETLTEQETTYIASLFSSRTFQSEMGAIMSESLLGTEEFIDTIVSKETSIAEKVMKKIKDLKAMFERLGNAEARAEYKRLSKAEKLYLNAIEKAGYKYRNGKILVRRKKEEIDSTSQNEYNSDEIQLSKKSNDYQEYYNPKIKNLLSSGEWKSWYNKRAEYIKGGNFVKIDDNILIPVSGTKVVVTDISFENPYAKDVLVLTDNFDGDANDLIAYIEKEVIKYGYSIQEIWKLVENVYGETIFNIHNGAVGVDSKSNQRRKPSNRQDDRTLQGDQDGEGTSTRSPKVDSEVKSSRKEDISSAITLRAKALPESKVRGNYIFSIKWRGELTNEKIVKYLKDGVWHNNDRTSFAKALKEYSSVEEAYENIYYHGTGGYIHNSIKPSIILPQDVDLGGGYDERYYAISVSKSKDRASTFTGVKSSGMVYTIILREGARVIEMPELQDSVELEDYIVDLWKNGVDAVKLGDWNDEFSEQELAILNPLAVAVGGSEYFRVFNKPKFQNYTLEEVKSLYTKSIKALENKDYDSKDLKFSRKVDTDSEGTRLSEGQIKFFQDAHCVDNQGRLLRVYHGTMSGDFTIFDISKANPESDMGAGFYFSSSYDDVGNNYEQGGQDLTAKIERLAERIEAEEEIDYEDALVKAEKQLKKETKLFEVYLDIKNPAYVGGYNDVATVLFDELVDEDISMEDYDSDDEYYEAMDIAREEKLQEIIDEVDNILSRQGIYGYEEWVNVLYENGAFDGGITITQLKEILNNNIYDCYNENGDIATNELVRAIIEALGYDAIIDNTVVDKWGYNSGRHTYMEGLDEDTRHFIVFKPEQIKLIDNKNPTSNPDIRFSRKENKQYYYQLSKGQIKKLFANNTHYKVYSKADAEKIINNVLSNYMAFGDKYGEISGKTKKEVIDMLWQGLNSAKPGYQTSVALNVADYIIQNSVLESMYGDIQDAEIQYAMDIIEVLRPYLHSIDLTSLKGEISYRYDTDKSPYLLWGKRKGESGKGADQIAMELEDFGIHIDAINEAEIFFEIDTQYRNAVKTLKKKAKEILSESLSKEELHDLRQDIAKEVLRGFDYTGDSSKLARVVEEYKKKIATLNEKLKDEKAHNKAVNGLLDKIQKIKDIKYETFLNATQYKNDLFKGSIEKLSKIKYRGNLNESGTRNILAGLLSWYDKKNPILNYIDENNQGMYDEEIHTMLEEIVNGKGTLKTKEVLALDNIVDHFTHLIENYNKVYRNGKYVDAQPIIENYLTIMEKNKGVKVGWLSKIFDKVFNNTKASYLQTFSDPITIARKMDMYEEGFYTEMLEALRRGGIGAATMEMNIREKLDEFLSKNKRFIKDLGKRTIEYKGKQIPISQAFLLYMTLNREQAIRGLAYSGFAYEDSKGETQRVQGFTADEDLTFEELVVLAKAEQETLYKQFSEVDKEYIEIAETIFNEDCKEAKKKTDIIRKGYSNVLEGYYVPIRRAFISKNIDQSTYIDETNRASNASFNKDTVQGAKNELFIEGLDSVLDRHIRAICQYANLSTIIDEYNILYNLDMGNNPNNTTSIKTQSVNVWKQGNDYFRELIGDIQNIPKQKGVGMRAIGFVRGSYAKYQLGANPKVWFTQLSSFFASSSILDYSSIVKGFGIKTPDVDEYCELAKLRNNDNSAAMAQGVLDRSTKTGRAIDKVNELGDLLMKPIGMMDRFVVKRLFGACQVQVEKDNGLKVGTTENKKKAGELLERVILETQQNALATERSAAMRSGNEIVRTFTMFTADSMKVIGRVIDSLGEISVLKAKIRQETDPEVKKSLEEKLKKANKKARKSITALGATAIFMALIAQAFRTLYNKDDEDDNIPLNMTVDAIGNLMGGLPLIKDVYAKLVEGYDLNNYTYSAINDLLDSFGAILNNEGKPAQQIKNVVNAIGQLTGIPTRNIYNFFYGITNRISPSTGYLIDNAFYNKNYSSDLAKAIENEDEDMIATIIGIMLNERVGSIENSKTRKEIDALVSKGYEVLPKSIGETITYEGEKITLTSKQREQFKKVYSKANETLASLVEGKYYESATDEVRAKAIKFIYDIYYNLAIEDLLGVDLETKNILFAKAVDIPSLAIIVATARALESDKDKDGKTISGSKKAKVQSYINSLKLNATQKYMIMGYLGYTNKYGASQVKRYIQSLSLTTSQKELLYEYSGYKN